MAEISPRKTSTAVDSLAGNYFVDRIQQVRLSAFVTTNDRGDVEFNRNLDERELGFTRVRRC